MLILGTLVQVRIEDREFLIDAMNVVRYLLPHILCLSTSSPFWQGRRTGLKSYRSIVFRNFPRTGGPPIMRSYADYDELRGSPVATGPVPDGAQIRWAAGAVPSDPAHDVRVCAGCT